MTDNMIKALEEMGFKRWTKGNYDRLYINAKDLGCEFEYYRTGNIKYAEFNGEKISNSRGYSMKAAKNYIDVKTGKAYSDNYTLLGKVEELLAKAQEVV